MEELTDQNKCMALQHTFRPIFVNYFKTNLYHRYKAVTYRRVLAEKGFDLVGLQSIWNEKHKVCMPYSIIYSAIIYIDFFLGLTGRYSCHC